MLRNFISKIIFWYEKHGLLNMFFVAGERIWRKIFRNRYVLFCLDFADLKESDMCFLNKNVILVQYEDPNDIPQKDIDQMISNMGKVIIEDMLQRFHTKGATLWIAKINGRVAGVQWSKIGGFDGFDAIPLTSKDVVPIAVFVYPDFRGQNIGPTMIQKMICELNKKGVNRVYINVNIWNTTQLHSVLKAGFKKIGVYREFKVLGRHITIWPQKDLAKR
jgi:RimJ/RimL family protein N-acetyltransferase